MDLKMYNFSKLISFTVITIFCSINIGAYSFEAACRASRRTISLQRTLAGSADGDSALALDWQCYLQRTQNSVSFEFMRLIRTETLIHISESCCHVHLEVRQTISLVCCASAHINQPTVTQPCMTSSILRFNIWHCITFCDVVCYVSE